MEAKKTMRPPSRTWEQIEAMTGDELRQELIGQGLDPDAEVAALRRLGRSLAVRFASRVEIDSQPAGLLRELPLFAEAVAAGRPAWVGTAGAPVRMASLVDVLGGATPEDNMWARVAGWSMRDDGINDGDLILVNVKLEAKDGDLVLAHLEGEGQLVKRMRLLDGKVVLRSANPDFADIVVHDSATLRIHGVVVGRAGTI